MAEKTKFSNPSVDIHHKLAEWAASCAEHTLHIFETSQLEDERPRLAIKSLHEWINGEKTMVEYRAAAFAAYAAARDAKQPDAVASARAAGQAVAVAHIFNHCSYAADYAVKQLCFIWRKSHKYRHTSKSANGIGSYCRKIYDQLDLQREFKLTDNL